MFKIVTIAAALAFSGAALPTAAGILQGRVSRVIDGDTIEILAASRPTRIRLAAIDAPERKCDQPFHEASRKALASLVAGKDVTIQVDGQDRYGRTIGRVKVDGLDVNAEQVRRGYAWQYRAYSSDPRLTGLELAARVAGRGLWRDPRAVPPWTWRHDFCRDVEQRG